MVAPAMSKVCRIARPLSHISGATKSTTVVGAFSSEASMRCDPLRIPKAPHRTTELLDQLLQFLARAALSINRSSSFTAA